MYWVHLGNSDVPVYPPKTDLIEKFAEEGAADEHLVPKSLGMGEVGSGGGQGERPQVLMITQGETRPSSRDSMRSAGNYSSTSQEYEMRVITDAERAAARCELFLLRPANIALSLDLTKSVSPSLSCLRAIGALLRGCWSISTSFSSYRWF